MNNRIKNARYRVSGVFFNRRQSGSMGFTLIELLVVLVIIALFSSMVVLSIGDNFQRQMQSEAERLQSIIRGAADEAVYTSTEFGLYLTETGYVPLQFNRFDNRWSVLAKKPFLPHELPEGMRIDWVVEGFAMPGDEQNNSARKLDIKELLDRDTKEQDEQGQSWFAQNEEQEQAQPDTVRLQPQILTLSSGEITVFSITFMAADERASKVSYQLASDGFSMPIITQPHSRDEET